MTLARPPAPPYYAVIFASQRTESDNGYDEMAERMAELAGTMPGFLGIESTRGVDGFGITVSYWESEAAIKNWKQNTDHLEAQKKGRADWYEDYEVRVAKVERVYGMKTDKRK